MVDIVAHDIVSSQTNLSHEQRKQLTLVLHNASMINGEKNTIINPTKCDIIMKNNRYNDPQFLEGRQPALSFYNQLIWRSQILL